MNNETTRIKGADQSRQGKQRENYCIHLNKKMLLLYVLMHAIRGCLITMVSVR
jgi:hypothetical protein